MLFNSLIFLFVFLPVTYLVFWQLRSANSRYVWLTLTGYVFYGYWDPRFCLLMAFSTLVSYFAGIGLFYTENEVRRKALLVLPITVDLLLLAFFKYFNFISDNMAYLAEGLNLSWRPINLDVILPIGISFYTFHTISYIVDSYRGVIKPTKNLFEFAAYVSLFSQLVAGPIVRFGQIENDLASLGRADRTRWLPRGIAFLIVGMVEKVVVADSLAAWVDPSLENYEVLSSAGVWLAMTGYSFQLYFDFCGYSSMAVGLGMMFGLRIPQNFNSPYQATDPSDFWRRWHISLSTCMRDYLYIPFGGSRYGAFTTDRNLMITMLIGGLWHGANWTFVMWGAYHGLLLILYRRFSRLWDQLPVYVRQFTMFFAVVIGWTWFRSVDVYMAGNLIVAMFVPTRGILPEQSSAFALIVFAAMLWACFAPNDFQLFGEYEWKPLHGYALAACFGVCLAVIMGGRNSPFLYFQF